MLRRYLPSVVKSIQHSAFSVQLIVADNGSTDNSLEVLAKEFPTVTTIVLDKNYGFVKDVEVTEEWLTPLLAYLDKHKDVAAVQPKIRSWLRRAYFEHAGAAGGYLSKFYFPYCRGRVLWHVEEDKGQYDSIVDVDWTSGACMCVRTKVYKECGGLDASFFAHMEEIDLCWRMRNAGWRLACIPQSVVYHLGGGALSYQKQTTPLRSAVRSWSVGLCRRVFLSAARPLGRFQGRLPSPQRLSRHAA